MAQTIASHCIAPAMPPDVWDRYDTSMVLANCPMKKHEVQSPIPNARTPKCSLLWAHVISSGKVIPQANCASHAPQITPIRVCDRASSKKLAMKKASASANTYPMRRVFRRLSK